MARLVQLSQPSVEWIEWDEAQLVELFARLDAWPEYTLPEGELSIAFLGHDDMAAVHGQFLDDATPTDVITFPGDPDMDFAGEICVGVQQAIEVAPEHDHDLAREVTLYLVHGWLHLAGLDDRKEADRAQMRLAETQALAYLDNTGGLAAVRLAHSE